MPKIGFKPGVRLSIACLKFFAMAGEQILHTAPGMIGDTIIVTSCDDSRHSPASFHYVGRALDVRCYGNRSGGVKPMVDAPNDGVLRNYQRPIAAKWVDRLKQALGPAFDVILESDHIHIEYQRGSPIN